MSYSTVLDVLASTDTPFTKKRWEELVETRKDFILARARGRLGLSLTQLGEVHHWKQKGNISEQVKNDLSPSFFSTAEGRKISLKTRGVWIFARQTYKVDEQHSNLATMLIYGFTLNGIWFSVHISFCLPVEGDVSHELQGKSVIACPIKLTELRGYGINPSEIFVDLGEIIRFHAERRDELAREAQKMWHCVEMENNLLKEQLP